LLYKEKRKFLNPEKKEENKMDYENTAKKILQRVGGKDNVINLVHCMTRLRFTLKDESIVDDEAVKKTKGVMGIMKKGGQYQIIIGNDVGNVFNELNKLGNFSNEVKEVPAKSNEKKNIFTMLMDTISGIMAPVIPAIIGAAMIKVLLTLLPMIGVLSTNGQTYQLLSVIGDGAFFFMPVLIAISASKKFGTNMYYAASIALIMLHPNLITLMNTAHDAGQTVKFLKYIPVTYASYSYSVIPIILAVYSLRYVERFVDKITPVVTKNFLKPMLVVLIEAPIALIILGPLGAICGNGLSTVVYAIHDKLGFIAIGLVAGVYPFDAYRTNRLRRFGYVRLLTSSGQEIHGHEFHYWESEDPGTDWEAVKPTGNRSWRCIHEKGGQIGGFPHLYYASCPDFLRKWLDVCAKGSQKKYIN
jgi:PTS system beta-glucosides-specific IIC component